MKEYFEQTFDFTDPSLVSIYDELPLWSAPFGLALLNTIKLQPSMNVLDIGCGTGFPLLELAQRLGQTCQVIGLDPWEAGIERIKLKIDTYNITNATVVKGVAEQIPLADGYCDLIVSNNGLNNVEDPSAAYAECFRVCRSGGQMVLTMNLPESMMEFYSVFGQTLENLGLHSELQRMHDQIASKRKPLNETQRLIEDAGFEVVEVSQESFVMRFLNGSSMLNYHFIRLAFLGGWKNVLQPEDVDRVFTLLEDKLNERSKMAGELRLTIPFVCIDCKKP